MEDEAAYSYFISTARSSLYKAKASIETKAYKDAILNLYKAEEWRDYFTAADSKFKTDTFTKEIEGIKLEIKKSALQDNVDLDSILQSLNIKRDMSSNLELKYHSSILPE